MEAPVKSYDEQTVDERIASLDKLTNLLIHENWREFYLLIAADADNMQRQMDEAQNWETFVAARAVRSYLRNRLMNLREAVVAEKAELEAEKAMTDEPLAPTDYEVE